MHAINTGLLSCSPLSDKPSHIIHHPRISERVPFCPYFAKNVLWESNHTFLCEHTMPKHHISYLAECFNSQSKTDRTPTRKFDVKQGHKQKNIVLTVKGFVGSWIGTGTRCLNKLAYILMNGTELYYHATVSNGNVWSRLMSSSQRGAHSVLWSVQVLFMNNKCIYKKAHESPTFLQGVSLWV